MSLGVFRQGNGLRGQCLVLFTKLSRAGGLSFSEVMDATTGYTFTPCAGSSVSCSRHPV